MASIQERKSKKGTTYRVQIRLKGHPSVQATFDRKTDARKWIQETESSIRQGRYFKTSESKKHTFAELAERYEEATMPPCWARRKGLRWGKGIVRFCSGEAFIRDEERAHKISQNQIRMIVL